MAFSLEVKEEVSILELPYAAKRAQLSALIKINGALVVRNSQLILNIKSEIVQTARFIYKALQEIYNIEPRLLVAKKTNLKKNNYYIVEINKDVKKILIDLEIIDTNNEVIFPGRTLLIDNDCYRSFLRGSFLASGSINPPTTKYYHLEINCHDESFADFLIKIFKKFNLTAKSLVRRNNYVVYIKKAEEISDFLRLIEASNALMKFEDERITRDFYNANNRLSICEISNEIKIIEAGKKQAELIQYLKEKNMLQLLNEKDQIIALLRLENPEISMQELAQLYYEKTNQTITKSGINHSIRRIKEISSNARKQQNQ